jgi:hypothetical protein
VSQDHKVFSFCVGILSFSLAGALVTSGAPHIVALLMAGYALMGIGNCARGMEEQDKRRGGRRG